MVMGGGVEKVMWVQFRVYLLYCISDDFSRNGSSTAHLWQPQACKVTAMRGQHSYIFLAGNQEGTDDINIVCKCLHD